MNRSLVRFEIEKSSLHTIVYGATGSSKTFFVKQYLKLYKNQEPYNREMVEGPPAFVDETRLEPSPTKAKAKAKKES